MLPCGGHRVSTGQWAPVASRSCRWGLELGGVITVDGVLVLVLHPCTYMGPCLELWDWTGSLIKRLHQAPEAGRYCPRRFLELPIEHLLPLSQTSHCQHLLCTASSDQEPVFPGPKVLRILAAICSNLLLPTTVRSDQLLPHPIFATDLRGGGVRSVRFASTRAGVDSPNPGCRCPSRRYRPRRFEHRRFTCLAPSFHRRPLPSLASRPVCRRIAPGL